ncbi:zinc finger CCCH domain-containing protein 8 [Acomys russatus]|uniref:zinc finger CCCH domain-containing protein 8 n=1 Tax=Acomys russatus TaxID=60746 RepID=UPI0021E313A6|nr:zinc finger CCCH domain-containing protein 8 [Acomys russatus]
MDFENLFSKPPNPALGKKPAANPEERTVDGPEVEETQTVKREVKRVCGKVPKKFKRPGNSTASPKSLPCRKSRSKDYEPYSDEETCGQGSENNFDKELQRYIQTKEMASVAQPSLLPEESVKKEGAGGTQQTVKQKNKKSKAGHKKVKEKKMKQKCPGPGNDGSRALLKNSGSQDKADEPEEKQPRVRMSQGFINQHTVERKGKQVCKYFLERKCIKGDQCNFDHDAELEKKKQMCKYYVQGYCTRGENCLYLHNEYPCKFYHTGAKCYQGDHCNFSHAPLTAETQELLAKVLGTEKKSCK